MRNGYFFTFEGPDGSGKTTVSTEIHRRLLAAGYPALYTREPGGIRISEAIRDIILNPVNTEMDARTEALLYAASRRQNVVEKILPALQAGQIVLCDRFVDSSLAYQGFGRQLGFQAVYDINLFAIEDCLPDVTYFLQVSAQIGLERIKKGRAAQDRLELETLAFHQRVYQGYQAVYNHFKDRMVKIDANQTSEAVIAQVYADIIERINHG